MAPRALSAPFLLAVYRLCREVSLAARRSAHQAQYAATRAAVFVLLLREHAPRCFVSLTSEKRVEVHDSLGDSEKS